MVRPGAETRDYVRREEFPVDFNTNCTVVGVPNEIFQKALRPEEGPQTAFLKREETLCTFCFSEPYYPIKLDCAHTWCKSCLAHFFTSSAHVKLFPITCLGENGKCSYKIPLSLAQDLLGGEEFKIVAKAAFFAHVQSKPNDYRFCPTPGCPQIYRTATPYSIFQCPSCLCRICPKCYLEYHDSTECSYESESLFREWADRNHVKNCPGCGTPIERIDGCNHITCIRCNTHICWVCMKPFPGGERIYDHMRFTHGGIGL